jgi:hypothetical protein
MACTRAASKAESVARIVLIANVVRAASKVGARHKTSQPSRRNSSIIVGGSDLVKFFFSRGAEFGSNLIFYLFVFGNT